MSKEFEELTKQKVIKAVDETETIITTSNIIKIIREIFSSATCTACPVPF